jgi:hypothetical protein
MSNNLMIHLKLLEKQEQTKPKSRTHKEVLEIRAEINKMSTKRINKTKVSSLKMINKIEGRDPDSQN